jgi:hypothetical protein
MDAVAQGLDQLTAIATAVGDAAIDEAATVPEALLMAMQEVAAAIEGARAQYAPTPATAEIDERAPESEPQPEKAAAPPAPEAAEKALPAPQMDPPFKTPLSDGDSLSMLLRKAVAAAHIELGEVEKAGRKISGARYQKLAELHQHLGGLLNDLAFDEATKKTTAGPDVTALQKALDEAKAAQARLEGKLSELGGRVEKALGAPAAPSNGAIVEENLSTATARNADVHWPSDLSAHVVQKRNLKAQATR